MSGSSATLLQNVQVFQEDAETQHVVYFLYKQKAPQGLFLIAFKKAFKDIQLEDEDGITTLLSLIDGFIRNQLNVSERKR